MKCNNKRVVTEAAVVPNAYMSQMPRLGQDRDSPFPCLGEHVSMEEIREMIRVADRDRDGLVTLVSVAITCFVFVCAATLSLTLCYGRHTLSLFVVLVIPNRRIFTVLCRHSNCSAILRVTFSTALFIELLYSSRHSSMFLSLQREIGIDESENQGMNNSIALHAQVYLIAIFNTIHTIH